MVIQGEYPRQLPVNGAEHSIFYLQPRGQGHIHQHHEGGRADEHLFPPDDLAEPAPLKGGELLPPAVDRPLAPEQVMEYLVQGTA